MNTHTCKIRIGTWLLTLAVLGATGCNHSPDAAAPALAQTAPGQRGHFQTVADTPAQGQAPAWGTSPTQGMVSHPFVFKADKKLKSVRLVGSFNKWDKTANPMTADADGLTWRLALPLAPGRYDYKFAPFGPEEGTWVPDPTAPRDETDKAHDNSLLTLVPQSIVYKADKKLKAVALVGSFNGWNKTANSMVADADGLTWRLEVPLAQGRYDYKFAPFAPDEQTWIPDPNAPRDETDKAHDNSLLVVAAPDGAAPAVANGAGHPFVFKADQKWKGVALVGSFNGWNKTANPMVADADGLTWRLSLPLEPGRYVYKFAQFGPNNEEKWVPDPNAPRDETDKVNVNSLLVVTPVGYEIPASPDDGITAASALFHPHGVRDISYDGGRVTLSLRARPNDLSDISLRSSHSKYPLKLVKGEGLYAYYSADLPWNRKEDLTYVFELRDGPRTEQFGADGLHPNARPFQIAARSFQPYLLTDASLPLKMNGPLTTRAVAGPTWAANQPIYEVNLDLYKFPKGQALREYEKHLPGLKAMGVGIVWFMPLTPRGYKKGFGSPYAVSDYTAINPYLGTKADFKHLVATAHGLGLRVIMDFVPNHTAWDNPMIEAHPEFYVHDGNGQIAQAYTWADTAQLDYGQGGKWNRPLWNTMRDNMVGWVRDCDVDGFRCDVAGSNGRVPVEFWNWLRPQLDAVKPIFMLAEADNAEVHPAFDMTYSWKLPPILWDVCAGRKPATVIDEALRDEARALPDGAIPMRFLDNHDWHPHADWGWGDGPAVEAKPGMPQVAPLMVLCATLPGKPLLYNGQEFGFAKTDPSPDAVAAAKSPVYPFYRSLLTLYRNQPALAAGDFARIPSNHDDKIYVFTRTRGANRVFVAVNLSESAQTVKLGANTLAGNYRDGFTGAGIRLNASPTLQLAPWGYRVLVENSK